MFPPLLIQEDLRGGSSGGSIDAFQQQVEEFFPACGQEPGITRKDAHYQASAKITPEGLGYLLLVTNSNLETALMFATLFALTIIGLLFFYAVELLETLLIPWHVTHRVRDEAGTL